MTYHYLGAKCSQCRYRMTCMLPKAMITRGLAFLLGYDLRSKKARKK